MSPEAEESTIHNDSHSFVDRKGGVILIKKLDDSMHQALIKKYLAGHANKRPVFGTPPAVPSNGASEQSETGTASPVEEGQAGDPSNEPNLRRESGTANHILVPRLVGHGWPAISSSSNALGDWSFCEEAVRNIAGAS